MTRARALQLSAIGAAALLIAIFFRPLASWFFPPDQEKAPAPSTATPVALQGDIREPDAARIPTLPAVELAEPARAALSRAMADYAAIHELLAADSIRGLDHVATSFSANLSAARAQAPAAIAAALDSLRTEAQKLAHAADLATARTAFQSISRWLIAITRADASLAESWHLFECSMTEGFNLWLQQSPDLKNPYQGSAMLTCGAPVPFTRLETTPGPAINSTFTTDHSGHGHRGSDIAHYTCSMHPSVESATPGDCPVCGMDLQGVTFDELESGVVFVDAARRQTIGVTTEKITRGPMHLSLRAVGTVTYDETRIHDVTVKFGGYIEKLLVDATGQAVRKGEPLFTLYSPELYAAQVEYLTALKSQQAARQTAMPARADYLVRAAKNKLALWDLTEAQIRAIGRRGKPQRAIPIRAPASGFVIEKQVVAGAAIAPGQKLYRIAALDEVWLEAEVYEKDLNLIEVGQPATVELPYAPDKTYEAKVSYIYPYLDESTRTGKIRIELANPELSLRPDMYANVLIDVRLENRLRVPISAVLYTGPRRIAFVDIGDSKMRPVEIELGARGERYFEVLSGLSPGQTVVTSGNFLIASESRIRSSFWRAKDAPASAPAPAKSTGHAGAHAH